MAETPPPIVIAPATVVAPLDYEETAREGAALRTEASEVGRAARAEISKMTVSQRRVNLIWEATQSFVAVIVVTTTCVGVMIFRWMSFRDNVQEVEKFPPEWWTIVGLVIGFYFGRTNHTRSGGVETHTETTR